MANLRRYWPVLACLGCVFGLASCGWLGGGGPSLIDRLFGGSDAAPHGANGAKSHGHTGILAAAPGLAHDLDKFLDPFIWAGLIIGLVGFVISFFIEIVPRKLCGGAVLTAFGLIVGKSYLLKYSEWFFAAITLGIIALAAPWVYATFLAAKHKALNPTQVPIGTRAVKHLLRKGKPNELAQRATDRLSVSDRGVRSVQGGDQGLGPDAHHPAREWTDGDRPSP